MLTARDLSKCARRVTAYVETDCRLEIKQVIVDMQNSQGVGPGKQTMCHTCSSSMEEVLKLLNKQNHFSEVEIVFERTYLPSQHSTQKKVCIVSWTIVLWTLHG